MTAVADANPAASLASKKSHEGIYSRPFPKLRKFQKFRKLRKFQDHTETKKKT